MVDLNLELQKIRGVKSYVNKMISLAKRGASYRQLDKLHYLVNDKLGIESYFYSKTESGLSNHVSYCCKCGQYLHHNNMERENWCVYIMNDTTYFSDIEIHFGEWVDDDYEEEFCCDCETPLEENYTEE